MPTFKFFKVQIPERELNVKINAKEAAFKTAYNTYYDSDIVGNEGKFTASYMLVNYDRTMRNKWNEFQEGWQKNHVKDNAYFYLSKIQDSLQVAVQNILQFLNHIVQKL